MAGAREIPFSSTIAAWCITVASIATAIAGLLIITDPSTLGLDANTVRVAAGWLALIGGVANIVSIALRRDKIPGVTSGVGLESRPAPVELTATIP